MLGAASLASRARPQTSATLAIKARTVPSLPAVAFQMAAIHTNPHPLPPASPGPPSMEAATPEHSGRLGGPFLS